MVGGTAAILPERLAIPAGSAQRRNRPAAAERAGTRLTGGPLVAEDLVRVFQHVRRLADGSGHVSRPVRARADGFVPVAQLARPRAEDFVHVSQPVRARADGFGHVI